MAIGETTPAEGVERIDELTAKEVQEAAARAAEIELRIAATARTTEELQYGLREHAEEVLTGETPEEDGGQHVTHLTEIVHALLIARATELEEAADVTPVSVEHTRERIREALSGVTGSPERTHSTAA